MSSMAFTPEEVEVGLLQQLLDYLITFGSKSKDCYQDIHVTTDGYCIIVEWESLYYNREISGDSGFKFVSENQAVTTEYKMPDNTYRYFLDDADYEEALETYNILKEDYGIIKEEKNLNSNLEVSSDDKK